MPNVSVLKNNVIEIKQKENQGESNRFITLPTETEQGQEVNKYWNVELLEGINLFEVNYIVKLTSKANRHSATFLKHEFQDPRRTEQVVNRLNRIGKAKPSYIKFIANIIDDLIYDEPNMVEKIENMEISAFSPITIDNGFTVIQYYKLIVDYINKNPHLFVLQKSNEYDHGLHEGAFLNKKMVKSEGGYPVAIKTGIVRKLLKIKSDIQYRAVIVDLVYLGVIEADLDSFGLDKGRKDKRLALGTKQEANVYIFNIIPSILEGGK